MATPTNLPAVSDPLTDFHKIGYNTYLYTPDSYTPNDPLILFFSWNAAAAKHIAKYTVGYRTQFPSARIVLVRNYTPDMLRSEPSIHKLQKHAREVVHEHVQSGGPVLVHHSSNGGANQVIEFARGWKAEYGEMLPMRVQIFDSGPAEGSWSKSHAAISASLPRSFVWRVFGSALVHLLLVSIFVFDKVTGTGNRLRTLCSQLNNPVLFKLVTPRVYLYSKADKMVDWEDVEAHADEAEAKGYKVQRVRFEKSPHVGHIMEDAEKYWNAIMGVWKSSS